MAVRRGDNGVKARRARAVALREAVRHGWDANAVAAALLGSTQPTFGMAWSVRLGWPSGAGPWRRAGGCCRRAGAPGGEPGCFQTAVRSDRDRWFGERVSPWWRAVAVQQPGAGVAEEKEGPANPRWLGSWPAPMAGVAGYRICRIGNAWALSDWLLPEAVMLRSARAALGSLAVRAPRTGTTWSRYSVTAL